MVRLVLRAPISNVPDLEVESPFVTQETDHDEEEEDRWVVSPQTCQKEFERLPRNMSLDNFLRDSQFAIPARLLCWCVVNHFFTQCSDGLVNFEFFSKFRIPVGRNRNFVSSAFNFATGSDGDDEVRYWAYKRNIVRLETKVSGDIVIQLLEYTRTTIIIVRFLMRSPRKQFSTIQEELYCKCQKIWV